jgi:hypothetical protein
MTQRKADTRLDFEALRLGIERCDPDFVLGFYDEDAELSIVHAGSPQGTPTEHARLSIVNAAAPQTAPFELRGKAEIAKHLRAIFGQGTSHRVERRVVGEERVTFREVCEYPDGSRIVVETTLEVRGGEIVRQVDVVARDARADREEEIDRRETEGEEK